MKSTISILTYTALEHAKKCIASVMAAGGDFDLILTANGNQVAANYFNELASRFKNIRVVVNEVNLGFVAPNRTALEMTETEAFIMLNDDCIVHRGWLEKLSEPFAKFPKAALSGPSSGCSQLDNNFNGGVGQRFEYLEGAILMCKTELVKKHGLFAPEISFAYSEDSDLSLRMRELGYTLHRVELPFSHIRSATSRGMPEVRKFQEMNHAYCRKRWAHYLKVRKFDYPTIIRRKHAWGDVLLTTPIIRALHEQRPCSPIWVETSCGAILHGNPHIARVDPVIHAPPDALVIDLNMAYENKTETHIVDAYAQAAGLTVYDKKTEVFKNGTASLLPEGDWCAVHVGPTAWRGKNWIDDRWKKVISKIPMKTVLIGHNGGNPFKADMDVRGKTSFSQLAAVLAGCKLCVSVDSLPIHVAQAVGTPVIGLFGVTDPKFILTEGSRSIGVHGDCPSFGQRHREAGTVSVDDYGASMHTITVDMVMDAITEILK